jgi:hypothetical protein
MRCAYPLLAQAVDVRWGAKYLGVSVPYRGATPVPRNVRLLHPCVNSPKVRRPDDDPPLGPGSLTGTARTAIPADVRAARSSRGQGIATVPK